MGGLITRSSRGGSIKHYHYNDQKQLIRTTGNDGDVYDEYIWKDGNIVSITESDGYYTATTYTSIPSQSIPFFGPEDAVLHGQGYFGATLKNLPSKETYGYSENGESHSYSTWDYTVKGDYVSQVSTHYSSDTYPEDESFATYTLSYE